MQFNEIADRHIFASVMWPLDEHEFALLKNVPFTTLKGIFRREYGLEEYLFCLYELWKKDPQMNCHVYEFNLHYQALRYLLTHGYVTVFSLSHEGFLVHDSKKKITITPKGEAHLFTELDSEYFNTKN